MSAATTPGDDSTGVGGAGPQDPPRRQSCSQGDVATDDTVADDRADPSARTDASTSADAMPARLARGTAIGRFIVIDKVGAGGMGEVFAAFDPELERKVAIKIIRSAADGRQPTAMARQRLLREAQAMAKVAHPNVITVYDVGTVDARVFIAMEYVDGHTLNAWVGDRDLQWRDVVAVYARAGQGLAAAHRAGLVHRDFKPENVLIGSDERVRVTDFGLVAATGQSVDLEPGDIAQSQLAQALTHTGTIMGTPRYMAPEQHHGRPVDARADQFSFCVALYEALYGELPFAGDTIVDIHANIDSGEMRQSPRDSTVPARILAVIKRGLQAEPERRHADMDELLAELAERPRSARRYLLVVPILVLGFAAVVVGLSMRASGSKCRQATARLSGVWDEPVRDRVRRTLLASNRPYAADTFERVARQLDDYVVSWSEEWTRACEATHVRGDQSGKLLDLRMACLDRRLGELASLTTLLGKQPDGELTDRAIRAVTELTEVSVCADTTALLGATPLPDDPGDRKRVAELRDRLDTIRALWRAGKYENAAKPAAAIAVAARNIAYAPLTTEALWLLALLERDLGQPQAAAETLREVIVAAARAGDDVALARAWVQSLDVVGSELGLYRDAAILRPVAEAAVIRAGNGDELQASLLHEIGSLLYNSGQCIEARNTLARSLELREQSRPPGLVIASTLGVLGDVEQRLGHFERAHDYHQRALAMVEATLGSDHPDLVHYLFELGSLLYTEGDVAASKPLLERALAIAERALGVDHPLVADTLTYLANLLVNRGSYDEARAMLDRAATIRNKHFGPDHPDVATSHLNLGRLLHHRGEYEQAQREYLRSLAIREHVYGPQHPDVAEALTSLGNLAHKQGDYPRAAEYDQRALAVWQQLHGPDHPDVGLALTNLGTALLRMGEATQARLHHRRALSIFEKTLGPDHPRVAATLTNLGNLLHAEGDLDGARKLHERSIAIKERTHGADHRDLAKSLNNLGDVLFELGELDDARDYFERALAMWKKELGPDHPDVGIAMHNLGNVHHARGQYDQAYRYHQRADELFAAALGELHPLRGYSLTGMGEALGESGKAVLALVPLEKALAIREARATSTTDLPMTRFALARALWDSRRDRRRASALAKTAASAYLAAGKAHVKAHAEVVEWLRRRSQ